MLEINKIYNQDCIEGLNGIKDNSIDLIIIDPPYGINYQSNRRKDKFEVIVNDDVLFIPLDDLWRVLKPSGCMFIFYSHKVPLIDNRVKNIIVWVKDNWTVGDLEGDFGNQYELCAFMPKNDFKLRSKRFSNVWNFKRIDGTKSLHPTQKPTDLIRRLVKCGSNEGDLVLDCFMGSGTTAEACKQLKRNFIGFEISKEYCDIANKRLQQENLLEILKTE